VTNRIVETFASIILGTIDKVTPKTLSDSHNDLLTAIELALAPAVVLGLARFAYALLLPSMRSQLALSLGQAGALNSANAAGYLVGALSSDTLALRLGTRRVFLWSLGSTTATLFLTAASKSVLLLIVLRGLSGAGGALAFITGAALASQIGVRGGRATVVLSTYFAGGGLGIVISGLLVPLLLSVTGASAGWRLGWILLGALGVAAFFPALIGARRCEEPPQRPSHDRHWPARRFLALLSSYGLFGLGYIAYITFIVAYIKDRGAHTTEVTVFWVVLGISSILSVVIWSAPIARLRRAHSTTLILLVVTVGAALPVVSRYPFVAYLSAILFGGSFLAVVTSVTSVARHSLPKHHWSEAIATLTVAFAVGQIVGPVLTGVISEGSAGLSVGLLVSASLLLLASIVALFQSDKPTAPS
jgi:predicted MFS family arabinose efflux permease